MKSMKTKKTATKKSNDRFPFGIKEKLGRSAQQNLIPTLDNDTVWVLLAEAKKGAQHRVTLYRHIDQVRVVKMWGKSDRILVKYADRQIGMFKWPGTGDGDLTPRVANDKFIGYACEGDGHADFLFREDR